MVSFAQDHRKSQHEPQQGEPGRNGNPRSAVKSKDTEAAVLPRYLTSQWVLQREPDTQAQNSSAPSSPTSGLMSGGLTPPSMLQPQDPYAQYLPDYASQFRLQPSTQVLLGSLLDPGRVAASVAARAQGWGGKSTTSTLTPSTSALPHVPLPPGSGWAPPPGSPKPQTGILKPPPQADSTRDAEPTGNESSAKPYAGPPKTASAGDVVSAVMALPSVSALLTDVKNDFLKRASSEWEAAGSGDKAIFIAHSAVVSSLVIAPVLGFEDSRNFILPLVSNTVIPVPGLPGYGVSFEFSERQVMIGAHLDVGSLLPLFLGFGGSSLTPLGNLSQAPVLPPPPIYPDREPGGAQPEFDAATIAQQLRTEQGRGHSLHGELTTSVGNALNTDLSNVAIHDDHRAHTLARELHARAFTVGSDIYFSAGRYQPHSTAGRELLVHELTHVAQQARGPVQGHPIGAGLSMSKPDDTHEIEARALAQRSTHTDTEQQPPANHLVTNQHSNQIQRQEEEEEELVAYGDAPDKRYTVMTTSGPRTNLTREAARALLRNHYHAVNLQYELGSGAHRELKKARDGSVLIGIGGWLTDLAGDNLPPLSIWDSTRAHLDSANASLAGGNLEAAGSALFSAVLENNKAATTYNAYLNQLESSANWATAGVVVVAVVAVIAYAAIATAAAGSSATGVTAGGATGTAEAVSGTATTVAATETAAGTGMATAAGAEITSGAVLEVIQTVAASMGNTQALHAYLTQLAASPAGRALLLAAARTAVAMSTQPEATRQEFQLLKQISELLFLFARGG